GPRPLVDGDAPDAVEAGRRRRPTVTEEALFAGARDRVHDAVGAELGDGAGAGEQEVAGRIEGEAVGHAEAHLQRGPIDPPEFPERTGALHDEACTCSRDT